MFWGIATQHVLTTGHLDGTGTILGWVPPVRPLWEGRSWSPSELQSCSQSPSAPLIAKSTPRQFEF